MQIRSKIVAFQIFFSCIALMMATALYVAADRAIYHLGRLAATHKQLEAITTLAVHSNQYSEQIAELLLLGDAEWPELEKARQDLEEGFAALEELIRQEVDFVDSEEEKETERQEFETVAKMRALVSEIHMSAELLRSLKRQGQGQEAIALLHNRIENRLDAEFGDLIAAAVADEGGSAALLLNRALSRPIGSLMRGADAIGQGDLNHCIVKIGGDELALLSRHFNKMAALLNDQRRGLLEAQSSLEDKVQQRTAQLEEANRRMKDLDRLRALFLADISHELRTPLTVLQGEAEVTLRGKAESLDAYRETLERMLRKVGQMGLLVDDLLFLARLEADSIRFERHRVCLQDVLDEALDEGRVLARTKSIALLHDYPDEPLFVYADPQRLKQAVVIAIDNAVKYSDANPSAHGGGPMAK